MQRRRKKIERNLLIDVKHFDIKREESIAKEEREKNKEEISV